MTGAGWLRLSLLGVLTFSLLMGAGLLGFRLASYQAPPPSLSVVQTAPQPQTFQAPRISLNRASTQALETLEGIGPIRAQAIVDYRSQHGPFRSLEELTQVRGIGPATLDKIRGRLTLD